MEIIDFSERITGSYSIFFKSCFETEKINIATLNCYRNISIVRTNLAAMTQSVFLSRNMLQRVVSGSTDIIFKSTQQIEWKAEMRAM